MLFILLLVLISYPSLAEKLTSNQNIEIGNANITLLGVGANSIKITINGQGAILGVDETKIINGIKISVIEIFYAGDKEIDYADISASSIYSCGDEKCDEGEKDTCCSDCGCPSNYECDNNKCELIIIPECEENIDCDDKNENTEDICKKNKCYNTFVCKINSQCKDNDECTKDYCEDGTCFNEDISGCGEIEEIKDEINLEETENITTTQSNVELKEEKVGFFKRIINFFWNLF